MEELENRFQNFAKRVRDLCRKFKWDIIKSKYIDQVIRSSASVSANYTEASDDLGKADEKNKIKTARREAKESIKWLDLLLTYDDRELEKERLLLMDEGNQIKRILSSILIKLENRQHLRK